MRYSVFNSIHVFIVCSYYFNSIHVFIVCSYKLHFKYNIIRIMNNDITIIYCQGRCCHALLLTPSAIYSNPYPPRRSTAFAALSEAFLSNFLLPFLVLLELFLDTVGGPASVRGGSRHLD